ncbi:unnamed protein product [Phaeothamnion confervicola]
MLSSFVLSTATDIVTLAYDDLVKGFDLSDDIARAFGSDALGILIVAGVPTLKEMRRRLLPLSHRLANLDPEVRRRYEHAPSTFSFGWSHGKESLEGRPDLSKGSFYANPQYDRPVDDEEVIAAYPTFAHPNMW